MVYIRLGHSKKKSTYFIQTCHTESFFDIFIHTSHIYLCFFTIFLSGLFFSIKINKFNFTKLFACQITFLLFILVMVWDLYLDNSSLLINGKNDECW